MIAAIMPCRGRAEQTVRNVRRLLATAGNVEWQLICAVDGDTDVMAALNELFEANKPPNAFWRYIAPEHGRKAGYWYVLQNVTELTGTDLIVNLANDLLPGQHWLARAYAAYRQTFGSGPGMIGFNDGHHELEHSTHFLISRALLDRYGGWPVWYDHNYGDTEICQRAIADGLYAKAPWAVLYHDHPYFGGQDDAVYAEGRSRAERDHVLFEERKRLGWPTISR